MSVKAIKNIEGRERPICPHCKCRMTLLRISPKDPQELSVYRCPGCGHETVIKPEART